jgi:hypothetical protein
MFLTLPQFEEPGMSALAADGQKYWRAVLAEFPVEPWYLFIYTGRVADARVNLTMLVSWEESLVNIIELVPSGDRQAVYRADPTAAGELRFSAIRELWAPSPDEEQQGVGAVFVFDGSGTPTDPQLRPVSSEVPRRLVYRSRAKEAGDTFERQSADRHH